MKDALHFWGARVCPEGTCFRVWAPGHQSMRIQLANADRTEEMSAVGGGWHEVYVGNAKAGTLYWLALPDRTLVADPASMCQPDGVEGPSEVVNLSSFAWSDAGWTGRPWHEAVIYELHTGAFTPPGTFRAAIDRLPHLAALGVTAIELMPVGCFAGKRNWGYDGVLPFAPATPYGRPEDLQALVDAAHSLGMMVILDVVYNHFGPQGNALNALAPEFFTERHPTPWGKGFDFEGQVPVRLFFIANAMHWLENYHMDGLRLDAVHAIVDDSDIHIVEELSATIRAAFPGRHIHLLLENEHNQSRLLARSSGGPRHFTAQWNDDVHHVLHVAATGESSGYYADYFNDGGKLGRAIAEGFAFQGEHMPFRGMPRGEPSSHLPPTAFVAFNQNHDQIGNRAFGERLPAVAPLAAVRAVSAISLLLPQIPMLFMGEEWASECPFPFFCDFSGELAKAVTQGRREEFARFPQFSDPAQRARIPDPVSAATFRSAKLDWDNMDKRECRETLEWHRSIIAVRRREIIPRLGGIQRGGRYETLSPRAVRVEWRCNNEVLTLLANLAPGPLGASPRPQGRTLWREGEVNDAFLGPWSVHWSVQRAS